MQTTSVSTYSPELPPLPSFSDDSQRNPYGLNPYDQMYKRAQQQTQSQSQLQSPSQPSQTQSQPITQGTSSYLLTPIDPISPAPRSDYSSPRNFSSTSASPNPAAAYDSPSTLQQQPQSQSNQYLGTHNGSSPSSSYSASGPVGIACGMSSSAPYGEELEALTSPRAGGVYRTRQISGEDAPIDPLQASPAPIHHYATYETSPGAQSTSSYHSNVYPSQSTSSQNQTYSTSPATSDHRDYLQPRISQDDYSARGRSHSASSQGHGSATGGEGLGLGSISGASSYKNTPETSIRPGMTQSASHATLQRSYGSQYGEGSTAAGAEDSGPEEVFDEAALAELCEMDCGMPLILDRLKQSVASSTEAAIFFKKRAQIEEEYARAMIKLARSSSQAYGVSEGKAG